MQGVLPIGELVYNILKFVNWTSFPFTQNSRKRRHSMAAWDLLTHLFQIKGKHYLSLVLCVKTTLQSNQLNFLSKEWQHLISLSLSLLYSIATNWKLLWKQVCQFSRIKRQWFYNLEFLLRNLKSVYWLVLYFAKLNSFIKMTSPSKKEFNLNLVFDWL